MTLMLSRLRDVWGDAATKLRRRARPLGLVLYSVWFALMLSVHLVRGCCGVMVPNLCCRPACPPPVRHCAARCCCSGRACQANSTMHHDARVPMPGAAARTPGSCCLPVADTACLTLGVTRGRRNADAATADAAGRAVLLSQPLHDCRRPFLFHWRLPVARWRSLDCDSCLRWFLWPTRLLQRPWLLLMAGDVM